MHTTLKRPRKELMTVQLLSLSREWIDTKTTSTADRREKSPQKLLSFFIRSTEIALLEAEKLHSSLRRAQKVSWLRKAYPLPRARTSLSAPSSREKIPTSGFTHSDTLKNPRKTTPGLFLTCWWQSWCATAQSARATGSASACAAR
jgi:hypothetical protein